MTISLDTSELAALAVDLNGAGVKATADVTTALEKGGEMVRAAWAANATVTAGVHGKHYPKSITAESTGPLEVEVGPDSSMMQGGMSFEYGSRNQPPHLDGNRAADTELPKIADSVVAALGDLLA